MTVTSYFLQKIIVMIMRCVYLGFDVHIHARTHARAYVRECVTNLTIYVYFYVIAK